MNAIKRLLDNNRTWAEFIQKEKPDFFPSLAQKQEPEYLWIGCSDSRVSATRAIDVEPGEIFVHRNIANVVAHTDLNVLSVMQYAVEVLQVKHIIVCGHYGCGGVKASMEDQDHGLIDNWLRHIKDVSRLHADTLNALRPEERFDKLCELNVVEQVTNVCNTTIVRNAWKRGAELAVHGWIYNLSNGIIKDLDISQSGL